MGVGLALVVVIWMANAHRLGFAMSDSVTYASFVIFYADLVVVFVTSRRYRLEQPLFRGVILVVGIALIITGVIQQHQRHS